MLVGYEECECGICKGHSDPDPRQLKGEMVFGGWKCTCACHCLTNPEERKAFIKRKKEWKLQKSNLDHPFKVN